MENYSKGKNVEEILTKENIGIIGLPQHFVWMQVKGSSKMRNLLELALHEYESGKDIVWSGSGPALGKTISCAEIMKKRFSPIHQFNKICYRRCEEHWDPKLEGLDPLVVNRDVPMIHILLSHQPINRGMPGFQMIGTKEEEGESNAKKKLVNTPHRKSKKHNTNQMESYGLKFNRKKNKKQT